MVKSIFKVIASSVVTLMIAGLMVSCEQRATPSSGASGTYGATLYIAGMGGHFAKADVIIDPNKTDQPITVAKLKRIKLGKSKDASGKKISPADTHPTHDPRIDSENPNILYWSTYKVDKEVKKATGKQVAHVGMTDLTTRKVIKEIEIELPDEAKARGSVYCASAQDKKHYIPITMTNKGYIDVYSKKDLTRVARVFLEGSEADIKAPYKFYHGASSNDSTKLFLSINESVTDHGKLVGKMHVFILDMAEFVKGNVKVLKKNVITTPTKNKRFIAFRADFSEDDRLIASSAAGQMIIINAADLTLKSAIEAPKGNDSHDAIFTPDGKYIIATMRVKQSNKIRPLDGHVQLYSVNSNRWIGKGTSTCYTCHKEEDIEGKAVLCGVDATGWVMN